MYAIGSIVPVVGIILVMDEIATLAGGCYWCLEAVYQEVNGVKSVVSGYMGGTKPNPTAQEVYRGDTGHAEVVQITFETKIISYKELLEIYFYIHDPTQLNRQGPDKGDEYRSAVFYHDDEQKKIAEEAKTEFAPTLWDGKIVTQIVKADRFWPAEDYNQNFYLNNQNAGYCQVVINPKLENFRKKFESKLKVST